MAMGERVVAVMTGRGGSKSIKDKNIYPLLGRPLMVYPILAAKNSKYIDDIYLTTDSKKLTTVAQGHGVKIIDRPSELCRDDSPHEHAILHAYKHLKQQGIKIDIMVLLLCNSASVLPSHLDEGIEALHKDPGLDSAATVSKYNEHHVIRAKTIMNGRLIPFLDDLEQRFDFRYTNRDSYGDAFFCDGGAWIMRVRCLENIETGGWPYRWMGRQVYPIISRGGCDVDNEEGLCLTEFWLRRNGFTESTTPYD